MKLNLLLCAVLTTLAASSIQAAIPIVENGKSVYVIYHDSAAPESVQLAASELQAYLQKVTGARLPTVSEPRGPMIALGCNSAAAKAGVCCDKVPLEGFSLITRGRNLYILGPDTAAGHKTEQGGTSAGTLNGVYAFIERFLGVRWLMPGLHGEYVKPLANLIIDDLDFHDSPFFLNRRVPYIQEREPAVKRWCARQRLGWSLFLAHSHNWDAIAPTAFQDHPDWFAEHGGARIPPRGRYKLCITNEGLIQAFAAKAMEFFDTHPDATCFSLSPSDSAGWCTCSQCQAMYEKDPQGKLSVTPAVIQFYNRVAEIVASRHPRKLLGGYVYASYVYPPTKPFRLAPNVFLVWAPSFDYGFTLYRPELQEQWDGLVAQWRKVTDNISYYDLPNCVHNELGAMNPPGIKILKFLYPRLKKVGMKGVYVYGNPAWGYAGPMNYLLAKLAWKPDADVEALFEEYIEKAYGEGAEEIKQFYRLLDDQTEQYYLAHPEETYRLSEGRLKDVYGRNLAQLERLYRSAESKVREPEAKARLEMLGANMTMLHWNLRQLRILDEAQAPSFCLPSDKFFAFLKPWVGSLALAPSEAVGKGTGPREKCDVKAVPVPNSEKIRPYLLRGSQQLIVKPLADEATVNFSLINSRGSLVKYQVYAGSALTDQGVVSRELPIRLSARDDYYLIKITARSATFRIEVKGAAWAVYGGEEGLHMLGRATPLYFQVPESTPRFHLSLASDAPGETAAARLFSPDGKQIASFACTSKPVDLQEIVVGTGQAGMWKLIVEPATTGAFDDVWVKLGAELSGYFSLAPGQALSVSVKPRR